MADPQTIDIGQARSAIALILNALSVSRVVCVDDTYEDAASVEILIVAAGSLDSAVLLDLLPEIGNVPEDQDVLKEHLRRLWNDFNAETRLDRAEKILAAARLKDNAGTDDMGDASILGELIPSEMFLTLSPKQWDERREELVQEQGGGKTLFLFDQDLSKTGYEAEAGIKIIASLLARNDTGNLICGLLTHTITPESQSRRWQELSDQYQIPRDRFLIVPKQHLSKDPLLFAQTLKWIALSPDFVNLKEKAKKIIADASSAAADRVEAISIYDLDHIVFQVSAAEGLWEPDMLFRLHALFHRLESRRLAHEGGELEIIASRLRSVSHIPTNAKIAPASSTWEIQRSELYETGDYVNKNHLPLEMGDIFEKTGSESKKRYVLLAQPCDLMVRNDGKRHPELVHVPVAEVVPASEQPPYATELGYFGADSSERWYVKLKQIHQVRVCLLDLCVMNEDGSATLDIDLTPPDPIRPAWKARYGILARLFRSRLNRLKSLSPVAGESREIAAFKEKLRSELVGDLLNEGLFKGSMVEKDGHHRIAYNCRRIDRLFGARSFGLLMDYTSCLGRPAYDREFGPTTQELA